ncbi:hypothetical protein ABW20_dc0100347 [Dactylellina cionopaga]|nr:hypothetical protein ABW20_dc0100347 [Dactylellina cionopaga]
MRIVLGWLYRAEPEIPGEFATDSATAVIMDILDAAHFLQIENLTKDYSQRIETGLEQVERSIGPATNCVKILNKIYCTGGSINIDYLRRFVQSQNEPKPMVRRYPNPPTLDDLLAACAKIENPDGKFFRDLNVATVHYLQSLD